MKPAPLKDSPKFVLQISKGIIRDPLIRRRVMFIVVAAALIMLFSGATFLAPHIDKNLLLFLGYWGACAWLTILSILMAMYDLLMVRAKTRQEERELNAEILRKMKDGQ